MTRPLLKIPTPCTFPKTFANLSSDQAFTAEMSFQREKKKKIILHSYPSAMMMMIKIAETGYAHQAFHDVFEVVGWRGGKVSWCLGLQAVAREGRTRLRRSKAGV